MSRQLSVLVAEDHPVNQRVIRLLLQNLEVKFDLANNGREAIQAAANKHYSVILMDCMMPEVDGFEAAYEIRRHEFERNKYTPIIACTALDKDRILERCVRSGMNDYLMKPISKELLRRKLSFWSLGSKPIHQIPITVVEEIARVESGNQDEPINRIYLDLLYGVQQLDEVLELFLTVTARLLTELKAAIANREVSAVRNIAHEIKGSSYAVNAREMAKICRELEHTAEAEDWTEAESLYNTLEHAFVRVHKFLQGKELPV